MGQVLIDQLDDATLAGYRQAAEASGRSLEDELREVIEAHRPDLPQDRAALVALSKRLRAMTPPDGPDGSDSTLLIRWDRDTDHGRWIDDGWADHVAGR